MKYALPLASFLVGLLWGAIHGAVWARLNIPFLSEFADRRRKQTLQLFQNQPEASPRAPQKPLAWGKFLSSAFGAVFGSVATGGLISYVEQTELAVTMYIVGLFMGLFPSALAILIALLAIIGAILWEVLS